MPKHEKSAAAEASRVPSTLEQAYAANPGIGRPMLMRLTGLTAYACAKFLDEKKAGKPTAENGPGTTGKTPAADRPGVSVREFGARFDFEARLRKTVGALCADRFVSEADIRARCGVPVPAFRMVAELPEFKACQIKDGGTVWWSTRENVDRARQMAMKWGISR